MNMHHLLLQGFIVVLVLCCCLIQIDQAHALSQPFGTKTSSREKTNHHRRSNHNSSRRQILQHAPAVAAAAIVATTSAASATAAEPAIMSTINEFLTRLHSIPTFCIVSPTGAAYMVFKSDQKMAIGYAFTTFQGALAVLGDAQRNADQKGYGDIWKDATITTIPLDIAVRLALKKRERRSQKEQTLDTLLNVIPGADERADGVAIDGRFKDQGRVPLFYVVTPGTESDKDEPLSLYFDRRDLVKDWNANHAGIALPSVKAIDLMGIFENTLRGRSDFLPSSNLVFVGGTETAEVAKELKRKEGTLAPYNPSLMII